MLLVLHGARKNVGDYLIRDRGLAILGAVHPEEEIVSQSRWTPLDPELTAVARAIVLCGGPGLATSFYPGIYPLVPNLADLDVPILPLALGWSGQPADDPDSFRFDAPSLRALSIIHERIGWSSVRDDLSLRIMQRAGVGAVRRSGCVAWYHLPSLGSAFTPPPLVERLVFTPPANARLVPEVLRLLHLLARRHPDAERWCSFHRGIRRDALTSGKAALASRVIATFARARGYRVLDAAYDLGALAAYDDADLHVGYRVHAHLDFLSRRRPSLLVSEDGRGRGQNLTFGAADLVAGARNLVAQVDRLLASEVDSGYPATAAAVAEIERTWPTMRDTVAQL